MLYQRFKLKNETAGEITINSPGGWRDATFKCKRGDKHDVDKEYISDLRFYKEARQFIIDIEDTQGINAEILLIHGTSKDKETYIDTTIGKLDLEELEKLNDKAKYVSCPVKRIGFKSLFYKRSKDKINLNDRVGIDGNVITNYPKLVIENAGRPLLQEYDGEYNNDFPELNLAGFLGSVNDEGSARNGSYTIGMAKANLNELGVFASLTMNPIPISLFEAEFDGEYTIDLDYQCINRVGTNVTNFGFRARPDQFVFELFYQIDDAPRVATNRVELNSSAYAVEQSYSATFNQTITLKKGQRFYLYGNNFVDINDTGAGTILHEVQMTGGTLNVQAVTTFRATSTNAYLVHEMFSIICESITGQSDSFYSEHLGNKLTHNGTYTENGEWSFLAFCTGHDLREIDKDGSLSFNELYQAVNLITPLCLSFQEINGINKIRVEHVSFNYQEVISQSFNAKYINEFTDKESYFSTIEIGFNKWEAEKVNGLNEPNGKRIYSTALKDVGTDYKATTNVIGSSQVMEVTRRKADEKTTDTQFDKNWFVLCVSRDLDSSDNPIRLSSLERNESFSIVSNYIEPDLAVNLRISPTMNVLRHGILINSGLIKYPGTEYKLTEGEGNLLMSTKTNEDYQGNYDTLELTEGQDIIWTYAERTESVPLFSGKLLKFRSPMSFDTYTSLKSDVDVDENGVLTKQKAIEVTDGVTTKAGWIIDLEYDHSDEPVGIFTIKESNNSIFGVSPISIQKMLIESGMFIQFENGNFTDL